MRLMPLLIAVTLVAGTSACGRTSNKTGSGSSAPTVAVATKDTRVETDPGNMPVSHHARNDQDNDSDNNNDDFSYGHAANRATIQAVTTLVKHYYAAAAADDGVRACSLIYALLAEEIPEVYGQPPGPPALRGETCAAVMAKLFRQNRQQLLTDFATLRIVDVRIKGHRALAILGFRAMPPRDILVHREHRLWKIGELLDTGLG